ELAGLDQQLLIDPEMPGRHIIEHDLTETAKGPGSFAAGFHTLLQVDQGGDQLLSLGQPPIDQIVDSSPALPGISASFQHVDLANSFGGTGWRPFADPL